jgi:hypothetical protein
MKRNGLGVCPGNAILMNAVAQTVRRGGEIGVPVVLLFRFA